MLAILMGSDRLRQAQGRVFEWRGIDTAQKRMLLFECGDQVTQAAFGVEDLAHRFVLVRSILCAQGIGLL